MSRVYIQRLRDIRDDLDITRETFAFLRLNWHRQEVADYFRLRTQQRVQQAEASLETTYFVRLTAEFEGILKDHLRSNHSGVHIPSNARIAWLISRTVQRESITVSVDLRIKLNEVRDYRNALAHGGVPVLVIPFATALSRYNTFLNYLPDPYKP